ncbi:lipid II flippase MurJ [Rhodoferax sp.]|uniref:murein biosynthesis integral membrane protein MurJ n=1 Tax=Rhodoferax sp. TaxID=50421 RepID=UPI0025E007CA|nr:lipid II flippase MurJ [Rhodoferax sp.]
MFSLLSLLPKFLALLKDVVIAGRFGAANLLDSYLMAFVLIGMPVSIMVVALQTVMIPALVQVEGSVAANRLLGGGLKLALLALALALPFWIAAVPWVLQTIFPAGVEGRNLPSVYESCWWLIPYYFLNGCNLLLYGALQARRSFWPNALIPGVFPLALLGSLWLMPEMALRPLLVGTVLGSALEFVAVFTLVLRGGVSFAGSLKESGILSKAVLALPLMLGAAMSTLVPVVEQMIAYGLGEGSVSLLSYGNKVPAALNSLLVTAIGIVVLPHFAQMLHRKEWHSCWRLYLYLGGLVFGGGILVVGCGLVFANLVIVLLFEHGAFSNIQSLQAADVMRMYLLQLPFLLVAMVAMRILAAMGKTVTITWVNALQLVVGTACAYALGKELGAAGVALGTSIGTMLGCGLLVWVAGKFLSDQSAKAEI